MIFNFIDPANGTSLYQNFGNDSHPVDFKECDDIVEKALAYDQISHYFKEADGKFLLFIKETCPYCQKAMSELTDKQIDYSKIDVNLSENKEKFEIIKKLVGRNTVPQVFCLQDGKKKYIGGCDDLMIYLQSNSH